MTSALHRERLRREGPATVCFQRQEPPAECVEVRVFRRTHEHVSIAPVAVRGVPSEVGETGSDDHTKGTESSLGSAVYCVSPAPCAIRAAYDGLTHAA